MTGANKFRIAEWQHRRCCTDKFCVQTSQRSLPEANKRERKINSKTKQTWMINHFDSIRGSIEKMQTSQCAQNFIVSIVDNIVSTKNINKRFRRWILVSERFPKRIYNNCAKQTKLAAIHHVFECKANDVSFQQHDTTESTTMALEFLHETMR